MPGNKMSGLANPPKGATHYNKNTLGFYKYSTNKDKMYYLSGNMWIELNHWPPRNAVKKMPAKAEQWTIYNNTLLLRDLTDEQYGKMRRMHDAGMEVEWRESSISRWELLTTPSWNADGVYRIKPKSERELFIEAAINHGIKPETQSVKQIFGELFDSGKFKYIDNTQHFGENI